MLHFAALSSTVGVEEGEGPLMEPDLTHLALLKAASSGGLHLPCVDYKMPLIDVEWMGVRHDLEVLTRYGLITHEGDVFHCPEVLLPGLMMFEGVGEALASLGNLVERVDQ